MLKNHQQTFTPPHREYPTNYLFKSHASTAAIDPRNSLLRSPNAPTRKKLNPSTGQSPPLNPPAERKTARAALPAGSSGNRASGSGSCGRAGSRARDRTRAGPFMRPGVDKAGRRCVGAGVTSVAACTAEALAGVAWLGKARARPRFGCA